MTHHVADDLRDLVDGRLEGRRLVEVERHLGQCARCRALLGLVRALRDESRRHLSADRLVELADAGVPLPSAPSPLASSQDAGVPVSPASSPPAPLPWTPSRDDPGGDGSDLPARVPEWSRAERSHLQTCELCRSALAWSADLRRAAIALQHEFEPAPEPAAVEPEAQAELEAAAALTAEMDALRRARRFETGLALARRQLELRRRWLEPGAVEIAESLQYLASFCEACAQYDEAESAIVEALAIQRDALGPKHPDVANSLSVHTGILRQGRGDLDAAERAAREALEIMTEAHGSDHRETGIMRHNLAWVKTAQGELREAEQLYREALRIGRRNPDANEMDMILSLHNLARVLQEQGELASAGHLYERALERLRAHAGDADPRVAYMLGNLGLLRRAQGDLGAAERLIRDALDRHVRSLGREHPDVAVDLVALGMVLERKGELVESRDRLRSARDVRARVVGHTHAEMVPTLCHLARVERKLGDLTEAEVLLEEAIALESRSPSPDPQRASAPWRELGRLREAQGETAEAEAHYRRTLSLLETSVEACHPLVVSVRCDLARMRWMQDDLVGAESEFEVAAEQFEVARLRAGDDLERAGFMRSPYVGLAGARLELGQEDAAWVAAELATGRVLADRLSSSSLSGFDDEHRVGSESDSAGGSESDSESGSVSDSVSDSESGSAGPGIPCTFFEWTTTPVSIEQVSEALSARSALVGWLDVEVGLGCSRSWAYVIRPERGLRWFRLASGKTLSYRDRIVSSLARGQTRVNTESEMGAALRQCWEERMAPMLPALDGVETLVVVPSGAMLGVPLDALEGSDGQPLHARFCISYVPSATFFVHSGSSVRPGGPKRRGTSESALFVGDPLFHRSHLRGAGRDSEAHEQGSAPDTSGTDARPDTSGTERRSHPSPAVLRSALAHSREALAELPQLPGSRQEVLGSSAGFRDATIWLGDDATDAAVRQLAESGELRRFSTLHFATHVLVDDEAPERSAIVLSQVGLSDPVESSMEGDVSRDGMITAAEIASSWRLDADLVVLSGCETGLGREVPGDGYVGLAHAFLGAGARCVLVTLWRIDDDATSLLMRRFHENRMGAYEGERAGRREAPLDPAAALREAKEWLRTGAESPQRERYSHPFYWAGFVLIGDHRGAP